MDRLLVFRPPRGAIPGADIAPGGGIVARALVYGTGDAERRFWQKVQQDLLRTQDWPVDRVGEAIGGLQSVVRTAPPNRVVGK